MPLPRIPRPVLALVLTTGCVPPPDPTDPDEQDSSSGDPYSSEAPASSSDSDAPDEHPAIETTTEQPNPDPDPDPDPECEPGDEQPCQYTGPAGTAMVGSCRPATRTCDPDGRWRACTGEVLPRAEDCRTDDDDNCDHQTECTGDIDWARSYGEPPFGEKGRSDVHKTAVDSQGRLWITGNFNETLRFGATDLTGLNDNNYYLARTDAHGEPQFAFADGRNKGSGAGYALAIDHDDRVAVGAYGFDTIQIATDAPIRGGPPSSALSVIGMLDAGGGYRHDIPMTTLDSGWTFVSALAYDHTGNLWAVGRFDQSHAKLGADPSSVVLEHHGGYDGLLMKLTPDGAISRAHSFGDEHDQSIFDIAVDAEGSVWLVGTHTGLLQFPGGALYAPADDYSQFVVKLDSDGHWAWGFSYSGTGDQSFSHVRVDSNGEAVVAGDYTAPSLTLGGHTTSKGDGDAAMLLARYDTHGKVLWAQSWPCSKSCSIRSLALDGAGQAIVAVYIGSDSTLTIADVHLHGSQTDVTALAKLDRDGTPTWPPRSYEAELDAALAPSGAIYLAGEFYEKVSFDDFQVDAGAADRDLLVAHLRP